MSIKQCTLVLLAAALAIPAMAQQKCCKGSDVASFSPKKGQWQVSMSFGNDNPYNDNSTYLLPSYSNTEGIIGLPGGGTDASGELAGILNIRGLNNNSLVNIAGLQAKYFATDCLAINFGLSMNINLTPSKNYVEGDYNTVPDMVIPAQHYINAQMSNNWYANVGVDRYFNSERFARIHPYLGAAVGFQMARITIAEPYTGEVYDDDLMKDPDFDQELADDVAGSMPKQVYVAGSKCGQTMGLKAAAVAGIEYSLAPGLVLGFEFHPVAYRYDIIQIAPQGFDVYNATHHNIKICEMPVLKLGFRF